MDVAAHQSYVTNKIAQSNAQYILGVDEVGMGCIAGPLTVGGVVFPNKWFDKTIKDSKKLSPNKRKKLLAGTIAENAAWFAIESCPSIEIDQRGIRVVLRKLIQKLVDKAMRELSGSVVVVVDGSSDLAPKTKRPVYTLPKGDKLVCAISAASIVAKVNRDQYMEYIAPQFPQYSFHQNKGYGTPGHLKALMSHGPCKIHRYSFRPLCDLYPDRLEKIKRRG